LNGNTFETRVNWLHTLGCPSGVCGGTPDVPDLEGERVAGPMSLFGGSLFFSTLIPGSASDPVCPEQQFRLWGMHYLTSGGAVTDGGEPRLPDEATGTTLVTAHAPKPGVVFGTAIEREPTCITQTEVASGDPFFGGGSHTRVESVNPGRFFLKVQVGGTSTSGTAAAVQPVELPPPTNRVKVDSWAAIFE
jgi:type IV pilus assembly protein PilY1